MNFLWIWADKPTVTSGIGIQKSRRWFYQKYQTVYLYLLYCVLWRYIRRSTLQSITCAVDCHGVDTEFPFVPTLFVSAYNFTTAPFNIHFSVTTIATLGHTNDSEFRAIIVCISVWGPSKCRKGIRLTQTWHFTMEYDSPSPYVQYTGIEMTASLVTSVFSQHIAQTLIS